MFPNVVWFLQLISNRSSVFWLDSKLKVCWGIVLSTNLQSLIGIGSAKLNYWSMCLLKIYYGELSHVTLFTFRILGWCMVCKWALPTPEIYLTIGSNQELSHLGSSCESHKLSFHVSELELRCKGHRRSKWWFSNSWSDCIDAFKLCSQLNLECVNVYWAQSWISL